MIFLDNLIERKLKERLTELDPDSFYLVVTSDSEVAKDLAAIVSNLGLKVVVVEADSLQVLKMSSRG